MGDILPATKLYHYRLVFAYCIGNGNYGVVLLLLFIFKDITGMSITYQSLHVRIEALIKRICMIVS